MIIEALVIFFPYYYYIIINGVFQKTLSHDISLKGEWNHPPLVSMFLLVVSWSVFDSFSNLEFNESPIKYLGNYSKGTDYNWR